MRAALYWVPAADDPLLALGNRWLGRDAELNVTVDRPDVPRLAELTTDARRYGLHATLRAPMGLRTAFSAFERAAQTIARESAPFAIPPLRLTLLDGFLALTLSKPCVAFDTLAARCVENTEPCRRPLTEAELARRLSAQLTPRERDLLDTYGYPYVLDRWSFHITLTRRLSGDEQATVLAAARTHFGQTLEQPRFCKEICICTERDPGSNFLLANRLRLSGGCVA